MNRGVEPIVFQGKEIACVYRKNLPVTDLLFLTSDDNPFQIGIHERARGTKIPAHIHNCPKPLTIAEIQEFLYVVSGSVKITLLTEAGSVIAQKTLSDGDSILLKSLAHKVEFTKNARVLEIKQGPYPGHEYAKTYLE